MNAALRLAAAGTRRYVRLIDLERVFTPGGRYRDYWSSYAFGDLTETAKTRKAVRGKKR